MAIGFVIYDRALERPELPGDFSHICDVREYVSLAQYRDPVYHCTQNLVKDVEFALREVSDDVELYITESDEHPRWKTPVFMGFSQGRRRAVPCVCIDMQTVALADLAEL